MPDNIRVLSCCPMGCGRTLECRGTDGVIMCKAIGCPKPYAVRDILADRETEHIVQFDRVGFTIRHPLRERLEDELLRCDLHLYCGNLPGPPGATGQYRAVTSDGSWEFQRIKDQQTPAKTPNEP